MRKYTILWSFLWMFIGVGTLQAGNPDRQGEAGAYELLMNPWARSAGWHSMTAAFVSGYEAERINPAGIVGLNKLELAFGSAQYLVPSGITMSSLGFAYRLSSSAAFGISLMNVNVGEIDLTTVNSPEGTGATFTPTLFNLGLSYAYEFKNEENPNAGRIRVGGLLRIVYEGITDAVASGVGLDAGVQYISGKRDQFKFGVSLRNLGTKMQYRGTGLGVVLVPGDIRTEVQAAGFDIPSLLHIGASYDFHFSKQLRMTVAGNFTANSYSRDELGIGAEVAFLERFMIRAAYKYDNRFGFDQYLDKVNNAYTGLSLGASFILDLFHTYNDDGTVRSTTKLAVDYSYRHSSPFAGTHNLTLAIKI